MERMERDKIAKRGYVGDCAGSVGRPRKRWINTVKDCLKKRGLDVRQARIMVHYRSVWRGFVRGNEPLTLTRYHSCEFQQLYEAFVGRKSVYGQAHTT